MFFSSFSSVFPVFSPSKLFVYLWWIYLRMFLLFFWQIFLMNFLTKFFDEFFWRIFWQFFWPIILTYTLLTIASFRIGVPSILFFRNVWNLQKKHTFHSVTFKTLLKFSNGQDSGRQFCYYLFCFCCCCGEFVIEIYHLCLH